MVRRFILVLVVAVLVAVVLVVAAVPAFAVAKKAVRYFSLSVGGNESQGATVKTDLMLPAAVGLIIGQAQGSDQVVEPFYYAPLGQVGTGPQQTPWDFTANGSTLAPGDYVIYLSHFGSDGRPIGLPPAPELANLSIANDGTPSVQMENWRTNGVSTLAATGIGIAGLVVGALLGVAGSLIILRRRQGRGA